MSTNRGGFTARSIGKTALLFVVTLGFYGVYWFHQLHKELKTETGGNYNPTVRTIGLMVPLYNLYVMWQDSQGIEDVLGKSAPTYFLLMLFLAPVWWYLVQSSINERAAGR
jgi:cbb3-type cytochrome oxidase subunit 3